MPKFVLITPIYERVDYRDLIEADSMEEAEKGNYKLIKELEACQDGDQYTPDWVENEIEEYEEGDEQ